MEEQCCICGKDISDLSELDRLSHIDKCLDQELEKKSEEIENIDTQKYIKPVIVHEDEESAPDFTGMPDYHHMPATEIKKILGDYGMKKSIETKQARAMLVEIWLYANRGVFPKFLEKYL